MLRSTLKMVGQRESTVGRVLALQMVSPDSISIVDPPSPARVILSTKSRVSPEYYWMWPPKQK